jgi:hypothetical protein
VTESTLKASGNEYFAIGQQCRRVVPVGVMETPCRFPNSRCGIVKFCTGEAVEIAVGAASDKDHPIGQQGGRVIFAAFNQAPGWLKLERCARAGLQHCESGAEKKK